jgi:hypothetical protein
MPNAQQHSAPPGATDRAPAAAAAKPSNATENPLSRSTPLTRYQPASVFLAQGSGNGQDTSETGSTLHVIATDQMRGFRSADSRIREQHVVALDWGLGEVPKRQPSHPDRQQRQRRSGDTRGHRLGRRPPSNPWLSSRPDLCFTRLGRGQPRSIVRNPTGPLSCVLR